MIEMTQTIVPDSRTAKRGSKWRACAVIDGRSYEATSRNGAAMELARVLIAADVPDQPVRLRSDDGRGHIDYRSLSWMATRTFDGDGTICVWRPMPKILRSEGGGNAKNRGEEVEGYPTSQNPEHLKEMADAS